MESPLNVEKLGPILEPTKNKFESKAVLNPACYQEGEFVHVFYRAIDSKNKSSIGYAKLKGPSQVVERWSKPIIERELAFESFGAEDPRMVKIGDIFYMTYVGHDGKNAVIAYATSTDLVHFEKHGIIGPQIAYDDAAKMFRGEKLKDRYFMFESYYEEYGGKDVLIWEKDGLLFPKKINGKYALIHRVLPDIHIAYFKSFQDLKKREFWVDHLKKLYKFVVLENKYWFESRNIGGGAPPIETDEGWLLIFHTVEELNKSRIYHASAALLDKKNPKKVIGRLNHPLFSPTESWEKKGFVSNVVFPTGTAIFGNDLYIYYGAADKSVCVAKTNLQKLLQALKYSGEH